MIITLRTESRHTTSCSTHHLLPSRTSLLNISNQSRKGSIGAMQNQYQRMLQAAPIHNRSLDINAWAENVHCYWGDNNEAPRQMEKRQNVQDRKEAFKARVLDEITKKGYTERSVRQLLEQASRRTMKWAVPRFSRFDTGVLCPETLDVYDVPWVWHKVRCSLTLPHMYVIVYVSCPARNV